jgi:hypothetical protein
MMTHATKRTVSLQDLVRLSKLRDTGFCREVVLSVDSGETLTQRVDSEGTPLCLLCDEVAVATVQRRQDLFCAGACYAAYIAKCTSNGLRRQVAFRDAGVCEMCDLDCQVLLEQLLVMSRVQDRRRLLAAKAPAFLQQADAVLDKLLQTPHMQYLWHCDHDVAVFEGGGLCTQSNARTLCVPCHRSQTTAQAGQRALQRAASALPKAVPAKKRKAATEKPPMVKRRSFTTVNWQDGDDDAWKVCTVGFYIFFR